MIFYSWEIRKDFVLYVDACALITTHLFVTHCIIAGTNYFSYVKQTF